MDVFGFDIGVNECRGVCYNGSKFEEVVVIPSVIYFSKDKVQVGSNRNLNGKTTTVSGFLWRCGLGKTVEIFGKRYPFQYLTSLVIAELKLRMEIFVGHIIYDAVFTVPNCFNYNMRTEIVESAKLAGFNDVKIIDHTSASALCFAFDLSHTKITRECRAIFCDLNRETFDVGVIEYGDGVCEVLGHGGIKMHSYDYSNKSWNGQFSQKQIDNIENSINECKEHTGEIYQAYIFGDESGIHGICDTLNSSSDRFIHLDYKNHNAIGACIYHGKLKGITDFCEYLLLSCTSMNYAIETTGSVATPMIKKDTTIPTKYSRIFSTSADGQTAIDIRVLHGNSTKAAENVVIGNDKYRLLIDSYQKRGEPRIEVTFDLDAFERILITAIDLNTKKELKVEPSSGLIVDEKNKRFITRIIRGYYEERAFMLMRDQFDKTKLNAALKECVTQELLPVLDNYYSETFVYSDSHSNERMYFRTLYQRMKNIL
jgi:chaperone protein dnaK